MKTWFTRFVTSFALLFAVLAGNITTIFADSGDIATYGMVCVCGNGTYQQTNRSETGWHRRTSNPSVPCIHHEFGSDFIEENTVTITYKCNYCGRGRTTTNTYSRRDCHGYDF